MINLNLTGNVVTVVKGMGIIALVVIVSLVVFPKSHVPNYRIAFLGNSITFVNDLPRFMESLGAGSIEQNSCLHGSLNFKSFLQKGNGMYHKWQTQNAILTTVEASTDDDASSTTSTSTIYDYGACTVKQLFLGYDKNLRYQNSNGKYKNDGMNPCLQDSSYYSYLHNITVTRHNAKVQSQSSKKSHSNDLLYHWDYIVMNDQTIYPGIVKKRQKSLKVLTTKYAKLFGQTAGTSRPVFMATYAYIKTTSSSEEEVTIDDDITGNVANDDIAADSANDDMTSSSSSASTDSIYTTLGSVSEFTSRIHYGYHLYASAVGDLLPRQQRPMVAPVGLCYLLVHDENYVFWRDKLFYDDGYHPSPHGTFVMGATLYATIYGRLPTLQCNKNDTTSSSLQYLWARARKMQMSDMGTSKPYPTWDEAQYLLSIVKRIVLYGEKPRSLLSFRQVQQLEAQEERETA